MRQILEDLYYGNIQPNEKGFSKDPEFAKATKALEKSEAFLRGVLNEEGKAALEEYEAANAKISKITFLECFIDGYRLGTRLTLAALSEDDGELHPIV